MADENHVWWRPGGRSPFSLDPSKPRLPQIISSAVQYAIIFGGPLLGLVAIKHYPFLIQERTLYIGGLGSFVFWFLANFALFHRAYFPEGMPGLFRLGFRVGWALCMTSLLLGLGGIANGYGTPLVIRKSAVVSKHQTLESDPLRRTYYVATRAWSGSRAVVELGAPREVYDRLDVPLTAIHTPQDVLEAMPDAAYVRLTIGDGRFGLEWLNRIDLP